MLKVHIISLGCPKNLVDSETIAGTLSNSGYLLCEEPKKADIIVINTCAFVNDARKEAYKTIADVSNIKSQHQKLIVCGCLPQYEKSELIQRFPKINIILGSSDFTEIIDAISAKKISSTDKIGTTEMVSVSKKPTVKISTPKFIISNEPKLFSTPKSYAYIKIADGCDNRCNYCIIPDLRGNFRSRPMEHILTDVKNAVLSGRKEVILIAQDTTMYGVELYKKFALTELLQKISKIKELEWIRLLYTHPAHFSDNLISEITSNEKICKYLDIPIQHTDDFILQQMGRPLPKTIFSTIEKLRKKIPDVALRTTIMLGFPGETEKSFAKLLHDLQQLQFYWLGGFVYSAQKGTAAYNMVDCLPQKTKKEYLNRILAAQQKITFLKNKNRVEKIFKVLADSPKYGHTEFQAPEIDGRVVFSTKQEVASIVGKSILRVKDIYDLVA